MNERAEVNMPVEVQDVLKRLEFFAQQERNMKPCVKQRTFVDANSWSGSIFRIIHGETSSGTICEINSILKEYGMCVRRFPSYKTLLEDCLARASKGFNNLFETYNHKPSVTSDLRVVMSMVDIFLSRQTVPIAINIIPQDIKRSSVPNDSHMPFDNFISESIED